jgi:hypothetical protein
MTGLSRQFTTAGLNLQQFQKVVGQNSVALARFRGLAGDGAEEFSKVVGNLTQKQDTDLRKIGLSAEDISSTTASFVTQQTRLGKSQALSTDQLTAGSKQYALELDLLSKVTGMSRAEIQKQQDAALSEGKFRANYDEMIANGNEKQAKALMNLQTRMQSFGAELGQGTRDLASGAANTDAAKKMVASTGGAALDIIARLKDGSIDENPYSSKTDIPPYEITGPKPELASIYDDAKTIKLIKEIDASNLTEDEKHLLRAAAYRHVVFNFQSIAEYYAHSNAQVQKLMEDSAMVIVDIGKAIQEGWAKLSNELDSAYEQDYPEDEENA